MVSTLCVQWTYPSSRFHLTSLSLQGCNIADSPSGGTCGTQELHNLALTNLESNLLTGFAKLNLEDEQRLPEAESARSKPMRTFIGYIDKSISAKDFGCICSELGRRWCQQPQMVEGRRSIRSTLCRNACSDVCWTSLRLDRHSLPLFASLVSLSSMCAFGGPDRHRHSIACRRIKKLSHSSQNLRRRNGETHLTIGIWSSRWRSRPATTHEFRLTQTF
jgi:hypothetical protein